MNNLVKVWTNILLCRVQDLRIDGNPWKIIAAFNVEVCSLVDISVTVNILRDFTVSLSGSCVFCLSHSSKESTMCCLSNAFRSGTHKDKEPGRREWANGLLLAGLPLIATSYLFIPWHRYHPAGNFATAIVSESEAFSTRGAYERLVEIMLFSCTTSEQQ